MPATLPSPSTKVVHPSDPTKALAVLLQEEFGVAFTFLHAATKERLRVPEGDVLKRLSSPELAGVFRLAGESRPGVIPLTSGDLLLVLPVPRSSPPALVAVASLPSLAPTPAATVLECRRLSKWLQAVSDRLRMTNDLPARHRADPAPDLPTGAAWEALLAFEPLLRRLRLHKEPAKHQQRILQSAAALVKSQVVAWVPGCADESIRVAGVTCPAPADCRRLAQAVAQGTEWHRAGFFLCNQVPRTSWGSAFPWVENLLAVAVPTHGPPGWVLALNRRASGEGEGGFRRGDAVLLASFAALLDLHGRGARRYYDLKELLVGLTRALTAAIDAKDSYTFGHSERVARVAVELGRELGLSAEELSDIYLVGLLHDIGKIGVHESVLCKPGPLTTAEYDHIKQHVTIGYKILSGLQPMRHLLPGVLHHHERVDGTGYPDGLKGETIALVARILAVADAYDAMSTPRPYRLAIPSERVEEILAQGSGSQWDQGVVDAFFRCRDQVRAVRQRGVGESLRLALEGALNREGSSLSEPGARADSSRM